MTSAPHIVTVVDRYPCLSETFVDREVGELRRQGLGVEVVALRGLGFPNHIALEI